MNAWYEKGHLDEQTSRKLDAKYSLLSRNIHEAVPEVRNLVLLMWARALRRSGMGVLHVEVM